MLKCNDHTLAHKSEVGVHRVWANFDSQTWLKIEIKKIKVFKIDWELHISA